MILHEQDLYIFPEKKWLNQNTLTTIHQIHRRVQLSKIIIWKFNNHLSQSYKQWENKQIMCVCIQLRNFTFWVPLGYGNYEPVPQMEPPSNLH